MANLQTLTCLNCGGKLETDKDPGETFACDYCGATLTVPGAEGERVIENVVLVLEESAPPPPPSWIAEQLPQVEDAIDARLDDLKTDKARLKEAARKIWLHALKKKDGDWDEVTKELSYLVREAKDIFEVAAGYLTDSRSEVRDFIEPIITVTRKSADARPLVETVQSFGQAMAEAQGGAVPGNLDSFSMPSMTPPAKPQRPVWQIALIVAGVGCCVLPILAALCVTMVSMAIVFMGR